MTGAAQTERAIRRADMDYLRVGALLLLIVYHVLLVFDAAAWWRVKSEHLGYWAEYLVSALSPWRMPLVFFVGGVAARFMLDRMSAAAFLRDRAAKLLTAFVFAIIVLVPLQNYVRLDDRGLETPAYLAYLINTAPFEVQHHGALIPDFAHAWFLPYLFVYSVAFAAFQRGAPELFAGLQRRTEQAPLWLLVTATMALLTFASAVIAPRLPETRLLFPDLVSHVRYAPVFLLGALVAKSDAFHAKVVGARRWLWLAAPVLFAIAIALHAIELESEHAPASVAIAWQAMRGVFGGAALYAVLAFAAVALTRPTKALAYATDAILPVYLMHQTALVVVADAVVKHHWPLALELATFFAAALFIPLALYHCLVRPNAAARVLFGLRPRARVAPQTIPAEASA